VGFSVQDLISFSLIIERDFVVRNCEFVTFSDLKRTNPNQDPGSNNVFVFDTRTIATFMHDVAKGLTDLGRTFLLWKQENLGQKAMLLQVREDLLQTKHSLNAIQEQNAQILEQNAQLIQLVNGGHLMSGLPALTPLQAAAVPAELAAASDSTEDEEYTDALELPASLKGLSAKGGFVNWYLRGYHRLKGGNSSVRSHVKFTVEYLNLFLNFHIEAKPQGRSDQARWRENLRNAADEVWTKASWFAEQHGRNGHKNLPETMTGFKKFMCACDPMTLPNGPSEGLCLFQPEGDPLRTKCELSINRKRKAVVDAVMAENDEDMNIEAIYDSNEPSEEIV
jgi:hypothetical protein